jgi:hypothetical protein
MPKYKPVNQTPDQIIATAEEVAFSAETLRMFAEKAKSRDLEVLQVGSFDQLEKALTFLTSYCSAVQKAITNQRTERGDLHSVSDSTEAKPRVRKKGESDAT